MALLRAAADLHHLHRDVRIGQHTGIDIPELLDNIFYKVVEVRLRCLTVGLHRLELCHWAANGDGGAGLVGQATSAGVEEHLHGLILLRRAHGIGSRDLAVLLCRSVRLRPRPDAPSLVRAAVAGGQCVLETETVLVQRCLRTIPASDSQSTAEVGNARTAVHYTDLHRIAQILEGKHDRHGEVRVVAVGTEVGNGVVCQLADSLCRAVEVVADTREKAVARGIIVDDFFCDRGIILVFHGYLSFPPRVTASR